METIECYSIVPPIFLRTRIWMATHTFRTYHLYSKTCVTLIQYLAAPYRPCVWLFLCCGSALSVCPTVFIWHCRKSCVYLQTTLRPPSPIITHHHTTQKYYSQYTWSLHSARSYPKMRAVTKYFSVNQSCWIICESFGTSRLLYISLFLRFWALCTSTYTDTTIYILVHILTLIFFRSPFTILVVVSNTDCSDYILVSQKPYYNEYCFMYIIIVSCILWYEHYYCILRCTRESTLCALA